MVWIIYLLIGIKFIIFVNEIKFNNSIYKLKDLNIFHFIFARKSNEKAGNGPRKCDIEVTTNHLKNDNISSQLISLWFHSRKEEENSYFYCFSSIHSLSGAFVVWVFVMRIICTLPCLASLSLQFIIHRSLHISHCTVGHTTSNDSSNMNHQSISVYKIQKETKAVSFPTGGYRYREGGGNFQPPSTAIKGFLQFKNKKNNKKFVF